MEKKNGASFFREGFQKRLFDGMPCGAAMHRILCDDGGAAIDYIVTSVNPAFISLLGVPEETIVNVRASERLSPEELRHWLRVFAPVALEGKTTTYTLYSPRNRQAYYSTAISPERGFFFVMFVKDTDWNPAIMACPESAPSRTRCLGRSYIPGTAILN